MNKSLIFKNTSKILNERAKYRVYCDCGHSMLIYPFEHKNKKLCSHCGKYVYRDNKIKFKDILMKKMEEMKRYV